MNSRQALLHITNLLTAADIAPTEAHSQAQLLLEHSLGRSRTELLLAGDVELSPDKLAELEAQAARLAQGEPLQYLLGTTEFYGLSFLCRPGVLIPRGDSECLVEYALTLLADRPTPRIADLCCGSGCLGLSLIQQLPTATLVAGDIATEAIRLTEANARNLGLAERVQTIQGDLFAPLEGASFDLIICNPPYIPTVELASLPANVQQEPMLALDGGTDGLDFYRRILAEAQRYLLPGGLLLLEHGDEQRPAICQLAANYGWQVDRLIDDYGHRPRGICLKPQAEQGECIISNPSRENIPTRLVEVDENSLAEAAVIIKNGGLVAFPTETVYGLGADALNAQAVAKIFAAKGRPADNPLIAHVCSWEMAERLAEFTPLARQLAERWWPGPLTLVLPRKNIVPDIVSAGLATVALRWPSHPAAARLIQLSATAIAAPSANRSGKPSPTLASHVAEDLAGRVEMILDNGPVEIGLESTVVDATGQYPLLLRPGRISFEQLEQACGHCDLPNTAAALRPSAPGMKYRHYAPQAPLLLAADWRQAEALASQADAEPLFIMDESSLAELRQHGVPEQRLISLGQDEQQWAARLFAALREADKRGARLIICRSTEQRGLGRAIMNRLNKAASGK